MFLVNSFWFLDKNKLQVASFELQVKYNKKIKIHNSR